MASRPFSFVDFQLQAAEIVDRARLDAAEIAREARSDAERIREQARAEGRNEGREAALREERKRLAGETQKAIDLIVHIIRDVDARRDALAAEAERDLVRLALAIAARIVKAEVKGKRPVAEENVRAAMTLAAHRQGVVARVHPDDLKLIELPRLGPVTLQADPGVDRGGCVVELHPGDIDLRIATQLEQIEQGLLG